jgi:hypothetical protein
MNSKTIDLWPTKIQIGSFDVDGEIILSAMNKQVSDKIHELARDAFNDYLEETLEISLSDYKSHKLLSWVNRYENTDMEYHTHNGSQLSAVFYPVVEGEGGEITFYDPRFFAARGYDMNFRKLYDKFVIKPESGMFVVFPSFLYHSVKVSHGFKISIPVDLFLFTEH